MKQVIMFQADDGHKFESAAECEIYEQEGALRKLAKEYFEITRGLDTQDIVDFIDDNWTAICDIKLNRVPAVEAAPSNDVIARHYAADWADEHTPAHASITIWHFNFERAHKQRLHELTQAVDNGE